MAFHILKCPNCGVQHEWDKNPPLYCRDCETVFDIKREPEQHMGLNAEPLTHTTKKKEISTMYDTNAFRFFGVESNTHKKAIKNVQQSSKVRAKLGAPILVSDPLDFLNRIPRDERSLRDAQNCIETPRSRITERLFWFINVNQNDAEALDKLKEGQYADAIRIWSTSEELSASINLTILCHAYYLTKDINAENTREWARIFERWGKLFRDEKYWAFFEELEQQSDFEPLATFDDFNSLKTDVWKMMVRPNVSCMKWAIATNSEDIFQRHLELIRTSNIPPRVISEIEYDILVPLEEKLIENFDEIYRQVSENGESSCSISEKKAVIDRILDSLRINTLNEVEGLLRLAGENSELSTNIREKTALCLRNIAISYHNETESSELAAAILEEARVYAKDTPVLMRINEDLAIISEAVDDAHEFEKFAEYCETIGGDDLEISKNQISFKGQCYEIQDATGIKYGVLEESFNGVPTTRSYAIWLRFGSDNCPVNSSSRCVSSSDQRIMMIECADKTWFGIDKIRNRFDEIISRLFHLVQIPLINKMIQDFESGKRIYISDIAIDFTGFYKDFSYNPVSKGLISLSSKLLGTIDLVTKEGKHKHLSWDNYRGYNTSDGKVWVFDAKGSWISLSARDHWNAVNLPYFLDHMREDGNLIRSIEKCISGVTAVKDEQSEVINTLDNSLKVDPNNWLTWWQKGRALKHLGRLEEALAAFDRVIEIVPNDPNAWNIKGLTLLETNKEVAALDCFERALEIDSQLAHVWYNKGIAYSQLADRQDNGEMTSTAFMNYQNAVRALDRSLAIEFDQDIKETRDQIQLNIQ